MSDMEKGDDDPRLTTNEMVAVYVDPIYSLATNINDSRERIISARTETPDNIPDIVIEQSSSAALHSESNSCLITMNPSLQQLILDKSLQSKAEIQNAAKIIPYIVDSTMIVMKILDDIHITLRSHSGKSDIPEIILDYVMSTDQLTERIKMASISSEQEIEFFTLAQLNQTMRDEFLYNIASAIYSASHQNPNETPKVKLLRRASAGLFGLGVARLAYTRGRREVDDENWKRVQKRILRSRVRMLQDLDILDTMITLKINNGNPNMIASNDEIKDLLMKMASCNPIIAMDKILFGEF